MFKRMMKKFNLILKRVNRYDRTVNNVCLEIDRLNQRSEKQLLSLIQKNN